MSVDTLVRQAAQEAAGAANTPAPEPEAARPALRTLAEILSDPEALRAPEPVVPRLAWKGRVTLLAGREKLGKSTLASAGAAATSSGKAFLGDFGTPGVVLWVGLEEHPGDTARRFEAFGAAPERVYLLERLEKPFRDLAAAVEKTGAVLVVVDTLAAFSETLVDDPGSSSKWTPVMGGITRVARDTGAAFLLLHHARKSDGAYRDSTAIGAGVDAVLELHPGEEASVRKIKGKGRWSIEDFSVRLDGERYTLTAGELSMDARVLLFVESNPDCSMRQLRDGVTGKNETKDAAVSRLLKRGALEDHGDGTGRRLRAGSGARSGAHPHAGAVPPENPQGHATGTGSGHGGEGGCAPFPNPKEAHRGTPPAELPLEDPAEPPTPAEEEVRL